MSVSTSPGCYASLTRYSLEESNSFSPANHKDQIINLIKLLSTYEMFSMFVNKHVKENIFKKQRHKIINFRCIYYNVYVLEIKIQKNIIANRNRNLWKYKSNK